MQPRARARQDHGFTLFELVVVLAVVAILVGMILPATSGTSSSARHIKCASNLKQIGLGFRGFAQDWDGAYPFHARNVTNFVGTPVGGTLVTSNTTPADVWMQFQMLSNDLNVAKIMICPSDFTRLNATAEDFSDQESPRGFAHASARNQALSFFLGINADENKPGLLLAGDRNLGPSSDRPPYSSLRQGGVVRVQLTTQWSKSTNYPQHAQRSNILFADGSVRQIKDAELHGSLQAAVTHYGIDANLLLFPQ